MFEEGSKLEKIGNFCFFGSGLKEFLAPPELKEIKGRAFMNCKNLKRVVLNEGLMVLGEDDRDFNGSSVKIYGVF